MTHSNHLQSSFGNTVSLKPSHDYNKLILLLYGLAVFGIVGLSLAWGVQLLLLLVASIYFKYLWHLNLPGKLYLHELTGLKYDLGFCLCVLTQNHGAKLIFQDQLKPDELRALRLQLLLV